MILYTHAREEHARQEKDTMVNAMGGGGEDQ